MPIWTVELRAKAYLDTTVQVEAGTCEEAYQEAYALDVKELEDAFVGEKFCLTGDAEVLGIDAAYDDPEGVA